MLGVWLHFGVGPSVLDKLSIMDTDARVVIFHGPMYMPIGRMLTVVSFLV